MNKYRNPLFNNNDLKKIKIIIIFKRKPLHLLITDCPPSRTHMKLKI